MFIKKYVIKNLNSFTYHKECALLVAVAYNQFLQGTQDKQKEDKINSDKDN